MSQAPPMPSLRWPLLGVTGVTALVAWGARAFAHAAPSREVLLGIASSAAAAMVGLVLKRLALERDIRYALVVTGATFALRLLLLAAGAVWVRSHGGDVRAFAIGFLIVFGVSQWVEIGYVAAAARRRV